MYVDLDVSELLPPDPMERILEALQGLAAGDWLRVKHRMQPYPLYNLLQGGGFAWNVRAKGPAQFEIRIWRLGDPGAEADMARTPW
jgi:uncharacterized protein (DUF2249 family)